MRKSLVLCVALLLSACGSKPAPPPPQESQELTREQIVTGWHQLYKAGAGQLDAHTAIIFALKLAEDGAEGLRPILDALKDPQGDPVAKVLAVISLTPVLNNDPDPALVSALETEFIANTAPAAEASTRACSAHLLAYIDTPAANARSRELIDDDDARVKMAAVLAALQHGRIDAVHDRVPALWADENTQPRDRDQLVLVLPETAEYNAIRAEAILDEEIDFASRMQALNVLGRVGDESIYDALAQCAEESSDPAIRDLAGKALAGLKEMNAPVIEVNPATAAPAEAASATIEEAQ